MYELIDEVGLIGTYLRKTRQMYPVRLPSREQKIVAALMWILRHVHHLEVPDIGDLVDGGWEAPTIRACTNSTRRPDIDAARKHLDEMTADSTKRKTTIRIGHTDQEPQGATARVGYIMRIKA